MLVFILSVQREPTKVEPFFIFARKTEMNYQETLDYMIGMLPMFQRVGKAAYRADLGNALELDEYYGHPHQKYKTIHIAGTNGKGSSSHYLASILQSAGYKTGLYTSPHLRDFRERIKVDGKMISEEAVVDFIGRSQAIIERLQPSFFELTMAMAFEYFAASEVDIAIVEVGMGGRLDSTNIIQPILSLITNIGFDHTDFLGTTLAAIAGEKAGIIKPNVPVVVSQTQSETRPVFEERAKQVGTSIVFADDHYLCSSFETTSLMTQTMEISLAEGATVRYETDLLGYCQHKNLCGILKAVDILKGIGLRLDDSAIREGILKASRQTGLNGRWQVIHREPLAICDTGHNEDGIKTVLRQIGAHQHETLHFVFGVVNDKNIEKILAMLPKDAEYYFTKASLPRALDATILAEQARAYGLKGEVYAKVSDAYHAALAKAGQNDMVFVGGSTFVVAEIL